MSRPQRHFRRDRRPQSLDVTFFFGEEVRKEHAYELPVGIQVTLGGKPVADLDVEFWFHGEQILAPVAKPSTDDKGKVRFFVGFYNDETDPPLDIKTVIGYHAEIPWEGRKITRPGLYPEQEFKKPEIKPAEKPVEPNMEVGVEGDVIQTTDFFVVVPIKTKGDKGHEIEAEITKGEGVKFTDAEKKADLAKNSKCCKITTNPDGDFRLGVEFKGQSEIVLKLRQPASKKERKLRLEFKAWR